MKSIIYKALIDGWKTVPVAIALVMLYLAANFGNLKKFAGSDTYPELTGITNGLMLGVLYACVLAIVLNWRYMDISSRGWLLSQPVSRSRIYWGNTIAAFLLYLLTFVPSCLAIYSYLSLYTPYYGPISPITLTLAVATGLFTSFTFYPSGVWILSREANWLGSRMIPVLLPIAISFFAFKTLLDRHPLRYSILTLSLLILSAAIVFYGAKYAYEVISNSPSDTPVKRMSSNGAIRLDCICYMVGLTANTSILSVILLLAWVQVTARQKYDPAIPKESRNRGMQITDNNELLVYDHNNYWKADSGKYLHIEKSSDLYINGQEEDLEVQKLRLWQPEAETSLTTRRVVPPHDEASTTVDITPELLVELHPPIGGQLIKNVQRSPLLPTGFRLITEDDWSLFQDYKGVAYIYSRNFGMWGKEYKLETRFDRGGFNDNRAPFSTNGFSPLIVLPKYKTEVKHDSIEDQQYRSTLQRLVIADQDGLYQVDFQKKEVKKLLTRPISFVAYVGPDKHHPVERLVIAGGGEATTYEIERDGETAPDREAIKAIHFRKTWKLPDSSNTFDQMVLLSKTKSGNLKLLSMDAISLRSRVVDLGSNGDSEEIATASYYDFHPADLATKASTSPHQFEQGLILSPAISVFSGASGYTGYWTLSPVLISGVCLQIISSLPLVWLISQRRMLSKKQAAIWGGLTILLGWGAPAAIAIIYPRVTRVKCKECRKIIRADDEPCPNCGTMEIVSTIAPRLTDNLRIV